MVPPTWTRASRRDPLRVIDGLFAARRARRLARAVLPQPPAQQGAAAPSPDWGVAAHFEALLAGEGAERAIPTLTKRALHTGALKPGMLVQFRGMVQDAFDPEYFQAEASCVNESTGAQFNVTCKYRDTIHVPPGCKAVEVDPQRAYFAQAAPCRASRFSACQCRAKTRGRVPRTLMK